MEYFSHPQKRPVAGQFCPLTPCCLTHCANCPNEHERNSRCFDSGNQVRVKFRKLDRFWNGMVHKDDGGKYVEVIKNGLHWEITKVERDRIIVPMKGGNQ